MSIIPVQFNFSVYIFNSFREFKMLNLGTEYTMNPIMLINNKAADLGVYLREQRFDTWLSISNKQSYVAYLAQPKPSIWNRPDLKVCEGSPRARHYHVCLSTAHCLRGAPSLVKKGEESFKSGNKAYISVQSQDEARYQAISIMVA